MHAACCLRSAHAVHAHALRAWHEMPSIFNALLGGVPAGCGQKHRFYSFYTVKPSILPPPGLKTLRPETRQSPAEDSLWGALGRSYTLLGRSWDDLMRSWALFLPLLAVFLRLFALILAFLAST